MLALRGTSANLDPALGKLGTGLATVTMRCMLLSLGKKPHPLNRCYIPSGLSAVNGEVVLS